MLRDTIIRRFAGTLAEAEGLLAVERATFNESPYSAEQVQAMLTGSAQRAWLALSGEQVIGFVAAFPTTGLRGPCWEIDLLAVHPDWTGQRLATRLVRTATTEGIEMARRARAAVAGDNTASARAFLRAGFRRAEACKLLIHRIGGASPRPWTALGVTVRAATSLEEAARWLPENAVSPAPGDSVTGDELQGDGDSIVLLAEYDGQPNGNSRSSRESNHFSSIVDGCVIVKNEKELLQNKHPCLMDKGLSDALTPFPRRQ